MNVQNSIPTQTNNISFRQCSEKSDKPEILKKLSTIHFSNIFSFLDWRSIISIEKTCRYFHVFSIGYRERYLLKSKEKKTEEWLEHYGFPVVKSFYLQSVLILLFKNADFIKKISIPFDDSLSLSVAIILMDYKINENNKSSKLNKIDYLSNIHLQDKERLERLSSIQITYDEIGIPHAPPGITKGEDFSYEEICLHVTATEETLVTLANEKEKQRRERQLAENSGEHGWVDIF